MFNKFGGINAVALPLLLFPHKGEVKVTVGVIAGGCVKITVSLSQHPPRSVTRTS
jgi:hypothetical protein